jgi:hypothetical protein
MREISRLSHGYFNLLERLKNGRVIVATQKGRKNFTSKERMKLPLGMAGKFAVRLLVMHINVLRHSHKARTEVRNLALHLS